MIKFLLADSSTPFYIGLLVVLAILYLGMCSGCVQFKTPAREDFEIKQEPSVGHCNTWFEIEREIKGHTICSERRFLNGHRLICGRALGHRGAHHMHGERDCLWIW